MMKSRTCPKRNACSPPLDFYSDGFVFLTQDQFERAAKAGALDVSMYGWGHHGPAYYGGRVVVRELTLGQ